MAGSGCDENEAVSLREARPLSAGQRKFDRNFQDAVIFSQDKPISEMDRSDVQLLNKMLHERPQLIATSCQFHYIRLAELLQVPTEDLRFLESAEDVLSNISAKQEVELTVADLLRKLKDSGQCFNVVRKLASQIAERGRNNMHH